MKLSATKNVFFIFDSMRIASSLLWRFL